METGFGAAIHKALLDADAIFLFLCQEFFESPWCVHELHFALGQYEVRGVPLFWVWCVPHRDGVDLEDSAVKSVRHWLSRPLNRKWERETNEYRRFHERERVERLIDHGMCLGPRIVAADDPATLDPAIDTLFGWTQRLYLRAGLPDPPATHPQKKRRGGKEN
jgi:hypothetical protein